MVALLSRANRANSEYGMEAMRRAALGKGCYRKSNAPSADTAALDGMKEMIMKTRNWLRFGRIILVGGGLLVTGYAIMGPLELAAQPTVEENSSKQLNRLFADYWEEGLKLNPMSALYQGDNRFLDKFDESLTDAYLASSIALNNKYLEALKQFNPAALSGQDRISYDMFKYLRERDKHFYASGLFEMARELPIDQFGGLHNEFASQASGNSIYPFHSVDDYEKNLTRADNFARWADQAIMRMKEGVARGVVQPRIVVERMLPQLMAQIEGPVEESVFFLPVKNMPKAFGAADRDRLTAAYREKITNVIRPAYQRLHSYLKTEYMPRARATSGVGSLPGGDKFYAYYVNYSTTTDMTPQQIHQIGLSEVNRIMGEFEKTRTEVGFKGSLLQFFAANRSDPALHFRSRQEVVDSYEALRSRINAKLPLLFDVMPKADYVIKPVPQFSEKSQAGAYYQSPSEDGSRPGQFWINTYMPSQRPKFLMTTLSLHEASPGHHFQISIAQESPNMPSFRKFDGSVAYVEGWALYAETLGYEMGLYSDPWQNYGHLDDEILRANRLVVDTGLHSMGWTREQAIKWMLDHSSISEVEAVSEVERYMSTPGQALAYKIGQLEISRLRAKAEQELGPRFDIRQFHNQVLLNGSMPLTILGEHITNWIEKSKGKQLVSQTAVP